MMSFKLRPACPLAVFALAISITFTACGGGAPADTTVPVITLSGTTPVDVEVNSGYTDAGATAVDDVDGDITASIVTVNPVNTAVVGTYVVTYDVTDTAGNPAVQVTRTVNTVAAADTTAYVDDLEGPALAFRCPQPGAVRVGAKAPISFDVSDSGEGLDETLITAAIFSLEDESGNDITETTVVSYDKSAGTLTYVPPGGLAKGTYTVNVGDVDGTCGSCKLLDKNGNESSFTWKFTVMTTIAPDVTAGGEIGLASVDELGIVYDSDGTVLYTGCPTKGTGGGADSGAYGPII